MLDKRPRRLSILLPSTNQQNTVSNKLKNYRLENTRNYVVWLAHDTML